MARHRRNCQQVFYQRPHGRGRGQLKIRGGRIEGATSAAARDQHDNVYFGDSRPAQAEGSSGYGEADAFKDFHRWMISHPLRAVLTKSCRFDLRIMNWRGSHLPSADRSAIDRNRRKTFRTTGYAAFPICRLAALRRKPAQKTDRVKCAPANWRPLSLNCGDDTDRCDGDAAAQRLCLRHSPRDVVSILVFAGPAQKRADRLTAAAQKFNAPITVDHRPAGRLSR